MKRLAGRVVVITGSSGGIGRETARLALALGAKVVINGRDAERLDRTRHSLSAALSPSSTSLLAVVADLSEPGEAQRLAALAVEHFGGIDVWINNAGLSMRGAFADLKPETVNALVGANFLSALYGAQAALPSLLASRGAVVFVSSLAALRGFPGVSAYSASKMAVRGLAESLRAEYGRQGLRSRLVLLPFTQNDPDKTVLAADGSRFRHERRWSTTQVQAAKAVLRSAVRRRSTTVVGFSGRVASFLQQHFPAVLGWFVDRSAGKLHAVAPAGGRP